MATAREPLEVVDPTVNVYLVGPGYGEAVVIVIGRRIVIGIDSCAALLPSGDNFLSTIMGTLAADPYIVWLVTHFHFDHFQGLCSVLRDHSRHLMKVVVPAEYRRADISYEVGNDASEDLGPAGELRAKSEYSRLRRLLERPEWHDRQIMHGGHVKILDLDLKVGDRRFTLSMDSYALSPPRIAAALRAALHRKSRDMGNEGSYVVQLSCGDFRGVFLGDAPASRFPPLSKLTGLDFLKVSHHGAKDGTTSQLIRAVAPIKKDAIAGIAPFTKHRLPVDSVIRMLRTSGFTIKASGRYRETDSHAEGRIRAQWSSIGVSRVRKEGRLRPIAISRHA